MAVAVLSLLALIALIAGVLLVIGRREHSAAAIELDGLLALPVDQARAQAEALLAESGLFVTVLAEDPPPDLGVPAGVMVLFSRYKEISRHEFWLGHAALRQFARLPGHIKIGGDAGFEEILVRHDHENVWLSYPPETLGQNLEAMPSIWHKLLIVASDREPTGRMSGRADR